MTHKFFVVDPVSVAAGNHSFAHFRHCCRLLGSRVGLSTPVPRIILPQFEQVTIFCPLGLEVITKTLTQ